MPAQLGSGAKSPRVGGSAHCAGSEPAGGGSRHPSAPSGEAAAFPALRGHLPGLQHSRELGVTEGQWVQDCDRTEDRPLPHTAGGVGFVQPDGLAAGARRAHRAAGGSPDRPVVPGTGAGF